MREIKNQIDAYRKELEKATARIKDAESLQELHTLFLGRKKGYVTLLMNAMKFLPPEEKRDAGQIINLFKKDVQDVLDGRQKSIQKSRIISFAADLTLPGRSPYWGAPHPLRLFQNRIESIFQKMGFSIEEGPEIETDFYNFEALNFPPEHPARDDWDTLYLDKDDWLLRTHTSPVQIRVMEKRKPPIRIICPGKVFRKEAPDPTHSPMFYQVEGLIVDHGITFAHLKGTIDFFLRTFFHEKIKVRFRPSFFPFTEPSAEVDISCTVCNQKDDNCRVCGGSGWVEILGAGMVDPQVLKNVNIDPEKYSGFAFGMGIDRTGMFQYQIPDLRYFFDNDLRFIRKFSRQ
ncbi:MAG: phenylalanine--tRNA ligase subunit alpha [Acidobacteria bacterium]|nr:phenylalanine--tRNA ligase subunit alpha [Acidobacteriota bacterium]MBU4494759.1 phenylalanine--tRNA ligase subunit alpha [Acidobacteriota bacterium]